ncbi:putative 3TM holin [Paraburkholderia eburnea]|uniref:Putative 3TM holin n=1 Tax=Paraburkholderia eburnea TaxID=1189126 RepID=A0A2S4LWC4_9BURK|nr:phage holin family protein [Paraburkholderia eburnea]POR46740.1 putative 3TM holin [Paraburkholderia eburnea]PRZ17929.1 putative 3TM holin [Paraburkholderia eburnea]
MHTTLAILAIAAQLAAVVRLLTYQRNGARHRHHVSWVAWLLVVILGGSAIELAMHAKHTGLFEAGKSFLLALFVFAAHGNVARLIRSEPQ